jgi:peptidoglycan/xylan/chitin deacetylase (PgdA/CDA1 family)
MTLRVHSVGGRYAEAARSYRAFRLVGKQAERPAVAVSGDDEVLVELAAGLPDVAVAPEAVVARARLRGLAVAPGDDVAVDRSEQLLRLASERGASSPLLLRAAPELLCELQAGEWYQARTAVRLLRRLLLAVPATHPWLARSRSAPVVRLAADAAFWRGVRSTASATQWRRLTSSYVALLYHRAAGEDRPGQARYDLPPATLRRQLTLLGRLGYRPLPFSDIVAFHRGELTSLPRRSYVVTFDDGYADAVTAAARHAWHRPQLFVPTAQVGGKPPWTAGAPLATWEDLGAAAASGVVVGSHGRRHRPLTELPPGGQDDEIGGSFAELRRRLPAAVRAFAYPNGRLDDEVRERVARAGYALAWTTEPGRNGAGTDPLQLRRVSPKAWDTAPLFLWKVITGENPPARLERVLARRAWLPVTAGLLRRTRRAAPPRWRRGDRATPLRPSQGRPPAEP